jgi:hypothetical protein
MIFRIPSLFLLLILSMSGFVASADQSIVLSHVSVSGDDVSLRWESGTPPFTVESSTDMKAWAEMMQTDEASAVVSPGDEGVFFLRVVSSPAEPALGEYLGQLRVDEGEFGGRLARHRLKSLWNFHLPIEGTPSRIPEEYFKALVIRLVYREGNGLETFVGRLEELPGAVIATKARELKVSWTFGEGDARRDYELMLAFPYAISASRTPINLSDPRYTLKCTYILPQPEAGFSEGQLAIEQTRVDEVSLYEMSAEPAPDWWRRDWSIKEGGVTVATEFTLGVPLLEGSMAFIWKTPLLSSWERTIISGLTTTPIEVTDRFTQTYDPEHHNFVETVWIEPALLPGLSEETHEELRAADIRFVVATNPTAFPEATPSLKIVGFDLRFRDL